MSNKTYKYTHKEFTNGYWRYYYNDDRKYRDPRVKGKGGKAPSTPPKPYSHEIVKKRETRRSVSLYELMIRQQLLTLVQIVGESPETFEDAIAAYGERAKKAYKKYRNGLAPKGFYASYGNSISYDEFYDDVFEFAAYTGDFSIFAD